MAACSNGAQADLRVRLIRGPRAGQRAAAGTGNLLDLLHHPEQVGAENLFDVALRIALLQQRFGNPGSMNASSMPSGIVAPSKSDPRPT